MTLLKQQAPVHFYSFFVNNSALEFIKRNLVVHLLFMIEH